MWFFLVEATFRKQRITSQSSNFDHVRVTNCGGCCRQKRSRSRNSEIFAYIYNTQNRRLKTARYLLLRSQVGRCLVVHPSWLLSRGNVVLSLFFARMCAMHWRRLLAALGLYAFIILVSYSLIFFLPFLLSPVQSSHSGSCVLAHLSAFFSSIFPPSRCACQHSLLWHENNHTYGSHSVIRS